MRRIPRRLFLSSSAAAAAALPIIGRARLEAMQNTDPVFRHGVASGDPLPDRVILWTRVTAPGDVVPVRWVVADDPKLARVVAGGEVQTGSERDYTVKVDVTGLRPATTYYYRFESGRGQSPIGRTRTLPARNVSRIRLGVVSCSNYPFGYFNAYAALARRADLDAILHLGDYIYEYQNGRFGDGGKIGRIPDPNAEILSLADYRARHAQYKADPDSQAIHRQHPFIVIWDDHELANNAWSGGAENHNPDKAEGDWFVRRNAAVRAYFEWMPIREDAASLGPRIYRGSDGAISPT
jgi:alkaline phosphatase D